MASSWNNFTKHIGSPQCAIERSNGLVKWRGFQHEPLLLVCCCAVVRLISLPSSLMHTRGFQFPNPVCRALTSLRRSGIEVWGQLWWSRCCLTHRARHNRPFLQEKKKNKNAKINLHRCPQVQTCHWILPFLYPSCVSKHHCTFALRTCPASHHESPELPALAAPRVCLWKAGAYLSPLSPAWSLAGKKIGTVLTSLQSQLRFGTQLLKSDMSMQGICAWKAKPPPAQGKFSIPFLSLCMRHSTFNSIPRDGNR